MATPTLEERVSAVEAQLAELRRVSGREGASPSRPAADTTAATHPTMGQKRAALRDQEPEAWQASPADLAEQHDYYAHGWPKIC